MTAGNRDLVHLETILQGLGEAVVACDPHARILLYNAAAKHLFRDYEGMGLGQPLYRVCARTPVEHTLKMLRHRFGARDGMDPAPADATFVCATVDGRMLLTCHISRIASETGEEGGFVFTFADMTRQLTGPARQGYLLDRMIKELRAPLTNLNTAAENLKAYPEMAPEMRRSFEEVLVRESGELTRCFAAIAREAEQIAGRQWPLVDVYSADLIDCVARRCAGEEEIKVTMTGVPLWLRADSYSLMLALTRLVRLVRDLRHAGAVDIETLLGDRRVAVDIVWQGEPLPQAALDAILTEPLAETVAGMTVAEVLAQHDSEIWSQGHRREGHALLRIPLPDSPRQWEVPPEPLSTRQEFYDFTLAESRGELGALAESPLASLNYVVFDTETTGLRPGAGDEILAIAAVRIVNGRILSGERFERLIKPQRPLPASALPFLEITEEMLREEPPARVILPKFKAFVNDAVLVAHNGALDLQFFRGMEDEAGVRFDNPLLDTLLLASVADRGRTDHTLAGIGRWLEIEVPGTGTSMDDCFATAQILLRLLERLAGMGITTLGEALAASARVVAEKRQQAG